MTRIILASQSQPRIELLSKMGIKFDTVPSAYEEHLDESKTAEDVAKELALGKALDVAATHPSAYVIGCDTVVAVDGRQLGKPVDIEGARRMHIALADRKSTISTGIAIVKADEAIQLVNVDTAIIYFKPNSDEVTKLREEYLATGDWKNRAGGYGIQSGAGPLIDRIEGNYDTVVGLPTQLVRGILTKLGVWK